MELNTEKWMERPLILRNECDDVIEVIIRPYRPGDEDAMLECIRDEYGDTYYKRDFYNTDYFARHEREGDMRFFVAEEGQDGIIGMMLLKQYMPENICEIASQMVRKRYRGYRLSMPFFEYAMDILRNEHYSAIYCLPVMFHDITQRSMRRLGFHATGVILNVFDVDRIVHSYDNGRNHKHSHGIQVKALRKKDAGIIYIPSKHGLFVDEIYRNLGVSCQISHNKPGFFRMKGKMPDESVIAFNEDYMQNSLEIRIHAVGYDLKQRIKELHEIFPLKGKQTAGVFLNCTDSNAVWAYEILSRMGYFFSGMRPLCGQNEYMVLHNPGEVKIAFKDYRTNDEFKKLINYVEVCCLER
jgi:N-acetylglutamate synthase-like GNAT family acetyltransferase